VRQQQRGTTQPRSRERRLGAGMTATNDDDIEIAREEHLVTTGASQRRRTEEMRDSRESFG
jgi:hypothetical protein